jgi:type IV pilus assembly protein PilV
MTAPRPACLASRAQGFTLVESMVTAIVLTVGMLGLGAMFVESLRASRTALYRTRAVTLAADLGERIRANSDPASAYDCSDPCVPGSAGNPAAIADLTEWTGAVAGQLPAGHVGIAFSAGTATTPGAYLITVLWTEPGQAEPARYELRVEI